ncbi:MAG TPA: hypothetical protein VH540_07365 [Ktedonobacterales bacterium]
MSHPFGDQVSQLVHRKHGLSLSKLARGIDQPHSVISLMCQGKRLTGPQARERVVTYGWNGKGGALKELGRSADSVAAYEEALAACERALELDPKMAEAWNGKGNVLLYL